jgi:DNA polymerase
VTAHFNPGDLLAKLERNHTIASVREVAQSCRGCELWKNGTQTVFGEGETPDATPGRQVMLVGEQPGDQEDKVGRPFVGPAGRVLDKALAEAGIDRASSYITNAVKHFKWEPRGKRRLHKKPNQGEITACRPWLEEEIRLLQPVAIVCLGATAAQALLGKSFRVTKDRGKIFETELGKVLATIHPSSLLRAPDSATRHRETEKFVADLAIVAPLLPRARGR